MGQPIARSSETADPSRLCDYCGLPCPPTPVVATYDGDEYEFCSSTCRDALEKNDFANETFHGFKRFTPPVPLLESQLPAGLLRNSFTLISSEPGANGETLLVELAWQTLQQGGSVAIVTYREPPISLVEQFLSLQWNVIPYLESGQLHFVDCFTYRVEESDRMLTRMDRWIKRIHGAVKAATRSVRDPTDLSSVGHMLDDCIEANEIRDRGIVVIDSLTELGTLVQPVQAYDFVKDLRADISKGRFIPVFAHAAYRQDDGEFPHDLTYMMDGVIDLCISCDPDDVYTTKRLCVRKMRGVPTAAKWTTYEYVADRGLVPTAPAVLRDSSTLSERNETATLEDANGSSSTRPY